MDKLAQWLTENTNGGVGLAPVVNRTNLTAVYDYEFARTGDNGGAGQRGGPSSKNPPNPGLGPEEYARYIAQVRGPNYQAADKAEAISDALEELGLKLQDEKISVDILVIDRIERPTPN